MTRAILPTGCLCAFAAYANAQYGPPSGNGGGGSGNPYPDGGGDDYPNAFTPAMEAIFTRFDGMLTAHATLATVTVGLLFPIGGIMIRLASSPRMWLFHALFQLFTWFFFVAAFVLGVYMAASTGQSNQAHAIVGIIVFVLLFVQPLLGFVHHRSFQKFGKRIAVSYSHIWIGRVAITLGMINGGLGLQLSKRTAIFPPHQSTVIGYSVLVAVIWVVYMSCAVLGEKRRRRQGRVIAEQEKDTRAVASSDGMMREA